MLDGREHEVAAVAARLRTFHAEPARMGPLYLHGVEPLPDGAIVLRLAQGKLAAALASDDAKRLGEAARAFVRRVCLGERADHYQALCARRDASPATVKENYHLLMALLHPDRQDAAAQGWPEACAQRVNLAYATLGDELARRQYDARLHTERPRVHSAPIAPQVARQRANEVRFAKAMIAVSVVTAVLIVTGLLVEDDEWGDRSVLETSFARLRANPAFAADRPRYVGAAAAPLRGSDAVVDDEARPFSLLKPIMQALAPAEPKPAAPVAAAAQAPAPAPVPVAAPPEPAPLRIAQSLPAAPPASPPKAATQKAGLTNLDMENLVISVIAYYEAGDADKLVGLIDAGFWRGEEARRAYSDFFRATRSRRLRMERLAWNATDGSAKAKGEAVVVAEYFEGAAPVEKRVDVEMDVVVRNGKPRISRLSLFPDAR